MNVNTDINPVQVLFYQVIFGGTPLAKFKTKVQAIVSSSNR
jgi:hypothetical protein